MVGTETTLHDVDSAAQERFSLGKAILVAQKPRQVVETNRHVWMIRTEALLVDREGAAVKQLGLGSAIRTPQYSGRTFSLGSAIFDSA
jgi:hypothetical protein